ncbi:MAG: prolipoprotein diacylglyceryl transferase [bacterium]
MFIHSYHPNPILFQIGPIKIYWYGFFIAMGILIAFIVARWVLGKYNIGIEYYYRAGRHRMDIDLVDLAVYLIIGGLAGARFLHIIAELKYYILRPFDIFKIWNGGLWIYGAIFGGFAGLAFYVNNSAILIPCETQSNSLEKGAQGKNYPHRISEKEETLKNEHPFCISKGYIIKFLLDLLSPGMVFAQAIGRWGNYFNQELYGLPTKLPWGIPIDTLHRVYGFTDNIFFHPVFLYESLLCAIIGILLVWMHKKKFAYFNSSFVKIGNIFLWYLFLYSFGRFFFEFIRIDLVPMICGIRITQIMAGIMLTASGTALFKKHFFVFLSLFKIKKYQ